jgi:type II secretory pathway component PulK
MKKQHTIRRTPMQSRRGAAMVFALVALIAATSIVAVLLRTASISHRQLKRDELRAQAVLLANAGIARAILKLHQHPDFTDETWNVPSEQFITGKTAVVQLKIVQQQEKRVLSATAEFPAGRADAVRVTHEITLPTHP